MRYLIDLHHGIGNIVCCIPMIHNIEENDSNSDISVILRKKNYSEVLSGINSISQIIELNKAYQFPLKGYDYGIVPYYSASNPYSIIMLVYMGCKKIIHSKKKYTNMHFCDQCNMVLSEIGYDRIHNIPKLNISFDRDKAREKLGIDSKRKVICVCVGGNSIYKVSPYNSSMKGITFKDWPNENYVELIELLSGENTVILLGGGKERGKIDIPDSSEIISLIGKTSISESAMVLAASDLVIGNDTGMMHVAGGIGAKTLSIHGPTNPSICGVRSNLSKFVVPESDICKFCYKDERSFYCDINFKCMKSITVYSVFKQIINILESK